MLRALILSVLLLLALVPAASAAGNIPGVDCSGSGVCVVFRNSDHETCAGVGVGLQGVVGCARPMEPCVVVLVGFNQFPVCLGMTLP